MKIKYKLFKHIIYLFIAILFSTLVVTLFNLGKYFYFLIPTSIFFLLNYGVKTYLAKRFGFEVYMNFLKIKRFWFSNQYKTKVDIPIWLIIPLFFSFISYGGLKILTIIGFDYKETLKRHTNRFVFAEYDIAKISIISSIISLILILLFVYFNLKEFAIVSAWLLLSTFLPFGNLDGAKVFYSNWMVWCFYFILYLFTIILTQISGIISSILIALILSLSISLYLLYKYIK